MEFTRDNAVTATIIPFPPSQDNDEVVDPPAQQLAQLEDQMRNIVRSALVLAIDASFNEACHQYPAMNGFTAARMIHKVVREQGSSLGGGRT